jgi:hypothetical protein
MKSAALFSVALVAALGVSDARTSQSRFDQAGWKADYEALKREIERSYSHLAWFASPQGGVDLPLLDRTTRDALRRARTDAEASDAIRRFVAAVHDGHFTAIPIPESSPAAPVEPPVVAAANDARTACAAFGFAPVTRSAFSLPFESLPEFELISDGLGDAFRSGVIRLSGLRIGLVRIPRFRPAEFPSLCERVWNDLRGRNREPTRAVVTALVDEEWLRVLAERLAALRARDIAALVVDIGGNGGGNDLGDWAVRLFTRAPVSSAPMLLSAGPVSIPYFDEQLQDLRQALNSTAELTESTRRALQQAIADFERRKQEASAPSCDMSWVWHEQRNWGTSACTRLIASGFASGALEYADPGTLPEQAARALYWPSRADKFRGAWNGPAYVLTNANTGSAAEMFAALIKDRGIARTVGARTFGLGCGFLDHNVPFVLAHARLAFNIPNCVRLRSDGTDEVAGVAPDIPVTPGPGESARSLAWRTLQAIARDRR